MTPDQHRTPGTHILSTTSRHAHVSHLSIYLGGKALENFHSFEESHILFQDYNFFLSVKSEFKIPLEKVFKKVFLLSFFFRTERTTKKPNLKLHLIQEARHLFSWSTFGYSVTAMITAQSEGVNWITCQYH